MDLDKTVAWAFLSGYNWMSKKRCAQKFSYFSIVNFSGGKYCLNNTTRKIIQNSCFGWTGYLYQGMDAYYYTCTWLWTHASFLRESVFARMKLPEHVSRFCSFQVEISIFQPFEKPICTLICLCDFCKKNI